MTLAGFGMVNALPTSNHANGVRVLEADFGGLWWWEGDFASDRRCGMGKL